MSNELLINPERDYKTLFDGSGMDSMLKSIEEKARSFDLDVTTEHGRKEIASVAYKVAKSKTAIDDAGKSLVEGIKKEAKLIDGERKKARDFLDGLKADIRKPLTEFENAEKERVAELEARIERLTTACLEIPETSAEIKALIERVEITDPATFQEYSSKAEAAKEVAIEKLTEAFAKAEKAEKDAIELEKLRKEQEERERKEREEKIRLEAEEKAKREAEAKAEAEKREAAEKVERERLEAENRHKQELAKQQAEAEARQRAILDEAERKEREAEEARKAEEARQKDKKHREAVANAAITSLVEFGINADSAKTLVRAIDAGKIQNVTINY